MIGGRHMRVGADHQAGATVAEKSHALLLAGRLAVEIHDDGVAGLAQRAGVELARHRGKRIVQRIHEHPTHRIDDQRALAVLGIDQRRAAPRRVPRKIQRPDQPRRAFDEHQRLLLIPGVVAERHRVGAGVEEIVVDRLGNAEAPGGVLAVDDDEVEAPVADQDGQMF